MILLASAWALPITGTITDPDGTPTVGAKVVIVDQRFRSSIVETDSGGRFVSEDLEAGPYRVRIEPPAGTSGAIGWSDGSLSACSSVAVPPGTDLQVRLPAGGTLRGTVVSPSGVGMAGVTVYTDPVEDEERELARDTETDDDGGFVLTGLPLGHRYRLYVQDGAGPLVLFGEEPDPRTAVDDQTLGDHSQPPGWTVTGSVRGPDGPIEGALVQTLSIGGTDLSDADGGYRIEGVGAGPLALYSSAFGFGDAFHSGPELEGLSGEAVYDLNLDPEARVIGTLSEGDAVVRAAGEQVRSVTVEGDGSFDIGRIPSGTYEIQAHRLGASVTDRAVQVEEGPVLVELDAGDILDLGPLDLPSSGRIHGSVTSSVTGSPVYGATLVADRDEGGRVVAFIDADGEYDLNGLAPGTYRMRVLYQRRCDTDPSWVSVYWPDARTDFFQPTFELLAGEEVEWLAQLPPDLDGDRMGDDWEQTHGLDVGRDDSDEDLDGDGFTNLEEYLLGTDPAQTIERAACGCAATTRGPWWLLLVWISLGPVRWRRRARPSV